MLARTSCTSFPYQNMGFRRRFSWLGDRRTHDSHVHTIPGSTGDFLTLVIPSTILSATDTVDVMAGPSRRRFLFEYAMNVELALNCLLMKVSGWAATGKEAVRLVNSWLRESDEVAGVKKLAAYLGCSFPTLYRMLKCEGTPLALAQFKAVCRYFKKPGERNPEGLQEDRHSDRGGRRREPSG